MSNFLPELIPDVLSYLPVKSLCRFKCVSKSWLTLINHPQFVKLHMVRTRRHKFLLVNGASLYHVDPETSLQETSCDNNYRKVVPIKHDHPLKENHKFRFCVWVSNSSNGLFCILMLPGHDFFIYNPSTRESKKIPDIKSSQLPYTIFDDIDDMIVPYNPSSILYGFAYVESVDDYKFVKVLIEGKTIQIFSLRNNSWKTIEFVFPFNVKINHMYGIPLNGAIHWVVDDDLLFHSIAIVAFDLVEEKFKTLPRLDVRGQKFTQFTVLGDYLCIINREEFWIMKEYGVTESWAKISIPQKPYKGKCLSKNSGFLFLTLDDDGWLFGYDKEEEKYKFTVFDGIRLYSTHVYMENLVSPNFLTGHN